MTMAIAIAIVIVIAIFTYIFISKFYIVGTPTCFIHRFKANEDYLNDTIKDVDTMLLRNGFHLVRQYAEYIKWDGRQTTVEFYPYKNSQEGTLFICSSEKYSHDWQKIAIDIEHTLRSPIMSIQTYIQLDPSIYDCNPNCSIDVKLPLDFLEFNKK